MSERTRQAAELFERCNCSQSVLAAFGPDLGMSQVDCLRVAACFGAGMGRTNKSCGALTGALMVLGLRHAKEMAADPRGGRDSVYGRVQRLAARFEQLHGSTECRELTGCDLSTPEGRQAFHERGLYQTLCRRLVESAVELLEEPES